MGDESVRWTVVVDRSMDIDLRTHLARRGMKKGAISKYVTEAVRWRLLQDAVTEAREGFKDMASDEITALIDEAIAAVRADPSAYDHDF